MTRGDSMLENPDCGGEAAAYALGALGPSDAAYFRRHLETCIVCRDETAAFEQIVDALAMAAPQHPVPHGLRRRVMRRVRAEPTTAAPRTRRRDPRSLFGRRINIARPALVVGLMVASALAMIGGLELAQGGPNGIRVIQAHVNGPVGSAQLRVAGDRAELIVSHLPPPSAGRIYEVWIERDDRAPSPRSLFSVTASGSAEVGVPGDVRGASTIMVTQERAAGSIVPTRPPVILAKLT